jgi:dTDP-4-dehydrorhamnose reductase
MKILVTGAKGMLGTDLCDRLRREHEVIGWDIKELDIADTAGLPAICALQPELIAHCAAHTNVDGCERDPEKAYQVNTLGTWNVARAAQQCNAALLYISTDFVFDGEKGEPYDEFDRPNPIGVYGRSKFAGEELVKQLLTRHFIVRTSWLFGQNGKNFVNTIREQAEKGFALRIVADQVGRPTYTVDLAEAIAGLIANPLYGTYHVTNSGECSWAQFAEEIVRQAGLKNSVIPVTSAEWPTPTRRPKDSRLRHLALEMQGKDNLRSWPEALKDYLRSKESQTGR